MDGLRGEGHFNLFGFEPLFDLQIPFLHLREVFPGVNAVPDMNDVRVERRVREFVETDEQISGLGARSEIRQTPGPGRKLEGVLEEGNPVEAERSPVLVGDDHLRGNGRHIAGRVGLRTGPNRPGGRDQQRHQAQPVNDLKPQFHCTRIICQAGP